ncbi:MAG: hypothetical protein LAT82_02360 [Nanoarchaeota archaeon]|nr:hypothetical protein [Nanoarchaeota archaeon]
MSEEFVLVSKEKIKEYETKIKDLEEKSKSIVNNESSEFLNQIKDILTQNNSTLISQISSKLEEKNNQKKDDNTSTKNNTLIDNKNSEDIKHILKKLESIETIERKTNLIHSDMKVNHKDTIENLKLLVEHLQDSDSIEYMSKGIEEIKSFISNSLSSSNEFLEDQFSNHLEIIEKLQEIELFMTNLRILLSYVKPRYIEREQ